MDLADNSQSIHGSTGVMLVPPLEWRVLSVQQPWAWLICYGLVLDQRAGLPAFRCRGKLGLWRPTPEIFAFYGRRL